MTKSRVRTMSSRITFTVPIVIFFTTLCLLVVASTLLSQDKAAANSAHLLTTLGEIGPDAVKLKVWTNKPPDSVFKMGDRVIIHFVADRDCHLAVLNVSKAGNVAVLFPNRETPDNSIKGGVEHTLFGDDSSMKLVMSQGISEATTVFYVSAEPFSLDPLKISEGKAVVKLSAEDKGLKILIGTLRQVSKKSGYNRVLLSIKGPKKAQGLRLMGPSPRKAAPHKSDSEIPETVTGAQGLKPQLDK
jgi:Domain of unknown function (DUF4384)